MANPQYAILRLAKYKGPEISRIEAHNERTKESYASNPDIDPARTHLNYHLVTPKRKYRAEAEKQIAEAKCRTRSDSVRVVEADSGKLTVKEQMEIAQKLSEYDDLRRIVENIPEEILTEYVKQNTRNMEEKSL